MSLGYDSSTIPLWRTLFDELDRNFLLLPIILLHVQLFLCLCESWPILLSQVSEVIEDRIKWRKELSGRDREKDAAQDMRECATEIYHIRPDALSECAARNNTNGEERRDEEKNWKRIFTYREIDDFFYRPKQKTH